MKETFLDTFRQSKFLKIQVSWRAFSKKAFVHTSEFMTTQYSIITIKKKQKRGQIKYAQNAI